MFQQITSYRKGKRLLKRVLPILTDVCVCVCVCVCV